MIHTIPLADLTPPARLLHIPGGTFLMGSDDTSEEAKYDGKPAHEVTVSDFYIGEFPVTQDLWTAVMGENPAGFPGERNPVEQVSWFDAAVFCNRLSAQTGRKPCYATPQGVTYGLAADERTWQLPNAGEVLTNFAADGYRLPTEAEWEYAARGGADNAPFSGVYAGSDRLEQVGWYDGNSGGSTREVGLLLPNVLGLYDMSGNVWEWCNDWYDSFGMKHVKDPRGPDKGVNRVLRGGGWGFVPRFCRVAFRLHDGPDRRGVLFGFRLVLQSVG